MTTASAGGKTPRSLRIRCRFRAGARGLGPSGMRLHSFEVSGMTGGAGAGTPSAGPRAELALQVGQGRFLGRIPGGNLRGGPGAGRRVGTQLPQGIRLGVEARELFVDGVVPGE